MTTPSFTPGSRTPSEAAVDYAARIAPAHRIILEGTDRIENNITAYSLSQVLTAFLEGAQMSASSEKSATDAEWDSPLDRSRLFIGEPCYRCSKVISAPLSHFCDLNKRKAAPSAIAPSTEQNCPERPSTMATPPLGAPTPYPGWIPVKERQPEGYGEVLVAHPVFSNTATEWCGVTIRSASTVRLWMSDKGDTSMEDAFWMWLPKGPL